MMLSPGLRQTALASTCPVRAPQPPARPLKIVFEGDSISYFTTSPVSMANQWIAANPQVASANLAVAGARIRANGGNSLEERRELVAAQRTADGGHRLVLCILIGANDLYDTATYPSVAEWQASLTALIAAYRADNPGIRIGIGTILPADGYVGAPYSRPGHNARRATVNTWLRAQVGGTIDFLIPYGEHPVMGLDSAAPGPAYADGLHPSAAGASYMLSVLDAVLRPIVEGVAEADTTPAPFGFADFNTAAPDTTYTAAKTISGLGMGRSAPASVSGAGDVARGAQPAGFAFTTGPVEVMNGDILTSRVTSSAVNGATVQHTLSVGGVSDTWDIKTSVTVATTVWDQARGDADLHYPTARKVVGPASGDSGYNSTNTAYGTNYRTGPEGRYFEIACGPETGGSVYGCGVGGHAKVSNDRPGAYNNAGGAGVSYRGDGRIYRAGGYTGGFPSFGAGDVIGHFLKNNTIWFLKNGVSISGEPGVSGGFALNPDHTTTGWYPAASMTRGESHTLNCGQDPFAYPLPAESAAWG